MPELRETRTPSTRMQDKDSETMTISKREDSRQRTGDKKRSRTRNQHADPEAIITDQRMKTNCLHKAREGGQSIGDPHSNLDSTPKSQNTGGNKRRVGSRL